MKEKLLHKLEIYANTINTFLVFFSFFITVDKIVLVSRLFLCYNISIEKGEKRNITGTDIHTWIQINKNGKWETLNLYIKKKEVMEYAENRGIPANFFYFTYSQNPNAVYAEMSRVPFKEKGAKNTHFFFRPLIYIKGQKPIRVNLAPNLREQPHYKEGWNFRVCWILEKATTPKDYELLVRIFMEDYFSEFHPDEACKDISRVWFGGKLGAFLYRTEPFSYQQFGYEKVIKKNEEKSTYDNRNIKKSKDGFIKAYANIEEPNAVGVSNNWWEYLNGRCDIWDRYQRGEYVPHNDMFKLCCELKYLKPLDTSRSIFKDIMRFYDPHVYEGHSFNEELLAKWFRDRTLKPVAGLVRADNGRMMTIPQFFSQIRGVGRKNSLEKTSLEVLDNWMDEKVPSLLDNDRTIYLKSQTGSGKTARLSFQI